MLVHRATRPPHEKPRRTSPNREDFLAPSLASRNLLRPASGKILTRAKACETILPGALYASLGGEMAEWFKAHAWKA
jgi:hypothetical protein